MEPLHFMFGWTYKNGYIINKLTTITCVGHPILPSLPLSHHSNPSSLSPGSLEFHPRPCSARAT